MSQHPQQVEDVTEVLEELEAKLETFQTGLNNAWDAIDDLQEELVEEREERRRLEKENEELQAEIERLDARTDLLRLVEESDKMTGKQRSVALIQNLRRAAKKERDRGREAKASVNREEAETALQHPDVDRTTIYTDMSRAARLVDNEDVLKYKSSSGGGSRLKLNLEAGELPNEIVGKDTNNGGR
ncbi:hypothetical protein SAMN06269185_3349 [Natronoarchaeum philippinense]|uniref:Uncharacterized protein n=1 Tax=Natronoarchaeum philippinense TaxID=558529 RepID=A0A285PAB1_NATPI|nr:hypothetical protein [Natronoarchaeum philippinense]SNZ18368.1 hypothetical protein SAMN06269185_3349 [Natronoarchaeum philippinense]